MSGWTRIGYTRWDGVETEVKTRDPKALRAALTALGCTYIWWERGEGEGIKGNPPASVVQAEQERQAHLHAECVRLYGGPPAQEAASS